MNKMILALLLGCLASDTVAQDAPPIGEVRISRPVLQIDLPSERRNVWIDEFDQIKGSYRLSNGKTMQLWMWGNRMYARIDGMPRSQLVAASPYVFVALDEKLKISIDENADSGRNEAEIIMNIPRLTGTTVVPEWTRLVARR
jgi:hypothetical protein